MPFLFLILLPFFLVSFVIAAHAYRRLTPEQKRQVDDRSESGWVHNILWIGLIFGVPTLLEALLPERASRWEMLALVGAFLLVTIYDLSLKPRSKNLPLPDDSGIPASYDLQIMFGYRVMQFGMTLFMIGCAALAVCST